MANANININISSKGAEKSLNTLQADIEATREELDRLIKTYGENSQEADRMRKNLAGLEVEMGKLGGAAEMAEQSTQSLKAQLRQMTNELAGLEPGSARFVELSQRAGQLRDQIKDTNAVINATAGSGVERFGKALGSAVQVGVAGFQGLIGLQALFGSENEDLQKQMVKLTAVLNVAQAISTFGQLKDTFTEIKAGVQPLITSFTTFIQQQFMVGTAATTATGAIAAEAVATEGATVATGGFAVALNALPFVAIATAIGLVVAGLVSYFSSSGDAADGTEKLTESQKRLEEQSKKNAEGTINEISGFRSYIDILAQTNNGSAERARIIDEVNSKYGTTLKNLADEQAFQMQLNNSVINYIALQKARYNIAGKKNALEDSYMRENLALTILNSKQAELNKLQSRTDTNNDILQNIKLLEQQVKGQQALIDKEKEYQLSVGKETQILIQQETEALKALGITETKKGDIRKSNTTITKNATDAEKDYQSIIDDINKITEETIKIEEETLTLKKEASKQIVDTKEQERKKLETEILKISEANRLYIEKEIKDQKKKAEFLKRNEEETTKALFAINMNYSVKLQQEQQDRIDNAIELNKYLVLEEKALQNEIRFGDGDTTDTIIENQNKRLQSYLKNLETQSLRSQLDNQLSVKQFTDLQLEKQKILEKYYEEEDKSIRQAAEAEYTRLLDLETKKYDLNKEYQIKKTEITNELGLKDYQIVVEFANKEIEVRQNQILQEMDLERKKLITKKEGLTKEQSDAIDAQNAKTIQVITNLQKELDANKVVIDNRQKLEENLRKTNSNLNEQYLTKLTEQNANFFSKIRELQVKTEDEIFKKRVESVENFLQTSQQLFSEFNSLVQQSQEMRYEKQQTLLDDYVNYEKSVLDQQLENRVITEEEYNARLKQIETKREQDLLQLKRKQFQQDKAMNIAEATIDAARATLSTFANTPGELIIKSIAAGIAAAFGAAQIALIAKQEFKAAVGGIVPQNGLSGNRDSVSATLAPGEAVINSNSTNAFLPILDFINRMGGGKSLMPEMPGDNGLNRFQPVYQQGSNQPVRAYVVSSDIENNMSRMNRIRRSTRF